MLKLDILAPGETSDVEKQSNNKSNSHTERYIDRGERDGYREEER